MGLSGFLALFFVLAFPYHGGYSLYATNELWRDLGILKELGQGHLVLLGPESSLGGFHFGPVYYYLTFPIAFLSNFSSWSLALTSLLYLAGTILLSFFLVKKWWGSERLAMIITFAMSLSVFTFQIAKYGSNPNFIPFFALLFFYFLEKFTSGLGKAIDAFGLGLAFGIVTQLHIIPMLSLPVIIGYFQIRKVARLGPKEWFAFFVAALLTYAPYLYYELTNSFANIGKLFAIANPHPSLFSGRVADYLSFWLAPFFSLHPSFDISEVLGLKKLLTLLGIWGLILVLLVYCHRIRRGFLRSESILSTPPKIKQILKVWILVPSVILLLPLGSTEGLRLYYFLIMFPAIFFLIGLGFHWLYQRGLRTVFYYLFGTFVLFQAWQIFEYYRLLNSLQ